MNDAKLPCVSCNHDIEQHRPIYDYGQRDRCFGVNPKHKLIPECVGHPCSCIGFTIKRKNNAQC